MPEDFHIKVKNISLNYKYAHISTNNSIHWHKGIFFIKFIYFNSIQHTLHQCRKDNFNNQNFLHLGDPIGASHEETAP